MQTVARQSVEHCQYRPPRIREDRNRKATSAEGVLGGGGWLENAGQGARPAFQSTGRDADPRALCHSDSDMPDHDLEPPRFSQLALERVLQDWNALRSMVLFGSQDSKDP